MPRVPIFRVNERLVYFAHVPKCGGSTVEHSLRESGLALSFLDQEFRARGRDAWSRSSPQHIPAEIRRLLFAEGFFDYEFAVVRDPVRRFLSAFNHNRGRIGRHVSLAAFLRRMERRVAARDDYFGARYDNHFLPACRFLSPAARVFFIEDGLGACLAALSADLGIEIAEAGPRNVKRYDFSGARSPLKRVLLKTLFRDSPTADQLSPEQAARIRALYHEDYARFPVYG